MCGIFAALSLKGGSLHFSTREINKALDTMVARGPNDASLAVKQSVADGKISDYLAPQRIRKAGLSSHILDQEVLEASLVMGTKT